MPSIVLGELWVGFLAGVHLVRNEVELQEFVAHPETERCWNAERELPLG